MSVISSVVNFEENLSKSLPYCHLLLGQMAESTVSVKVCEHAAMASGDENSVISKICEGYQFVIAFSGKLFNTAPLFEKLSAFGYRFSDKSDAELALFCYIHFGEDSPGLLSGNFSYIIYDSMRRMVFCAVDDIASMPLFYSRLSGGAVISSKIAGILSHPDIPACTDAKNISRLILASPKVAENVFDNIRALPPSHTLKITSRGITEREYEACTSPLSSLEIAEEMLSGNKASVSMVYTGSEYDADLLRLLTEIGTPSQITVYSCDYYDIFRETSAKWQKLSFCEESILTSFEQIVKICGIPRLSGGDFVLSGALRRFCSSGELIFTAFSANTEGLGYADILKENNAYHSPVSDTLLWEDSPLGFILNVPGIIADSYGARLCSPFLRSSGAFSAPESARTALRHILLSIISRDTSPVLAFFRSGALLRLCEGGFGLSAFSEAQLISYIIKLNIWLATFHPIIL